MRKWFSAALLVAALAYLGYGLATLDIFNRAGRAGPGYFPVLIGVLLVLTLAINVFKEFRPYRARAASQTGPMSDAQAMSNAVGADATHKDMDSGDGSYNRDVLVLFAMLFGFIALLPTLGGLLAMIVFMLVFLFVFNPGKWVVNLVYSAALPLGLYWLFKIMLNASLPRGLFGF